MAGVIHRDLKPENIMLNEQNRIKIADFGLAREIIGSDIYKLEKYSAKGTPIYAAPQVIRGKVFSGLCDVWSCGLLIYELLTGKHYFETATVHPIPNLEYVQPAESAGQALERILQGAIPF